ncbi:MAG: hypothetical protein WBQ79_14320 [Acidobacteriaceae bacterium]
MRHVRVPLLCLLCLCLIALVAGCGSTVSGGGSTDSGTFTLGAEPSLTIAQGQSITLTVTPTSANQFTGSIQVSVSGLPAGVTVSPASATVKMGSNTPFTLTAAADAAVGTSTVKVYGSSGTLSANTSVALTVTAPTPPASGDFTLTASPTTLTLAPGASGQVTLSSTARGNFSGTIAVGVNNLPSGVTASPSTISLSPNNPVVVTLTAAANATVTATPEQVSFVGTSGTLSHTATIQLTIAAAVPPGPDFAITATPNTVTVVQGQQSGEIEIGVSGSNGFAGVVTYTVSGLPAGVTVIPPTSKLQDGWAVPMVFNATSDAAIGNATVTVTGTSGALIHTATVTLTVAGPPPPDSISMTLSPTSETITVGSIGQVSVTATTPPEYTDQITVTLQNLPAGVTASPASALLTPGVPQNFILMAAENATLGTSTVTFLGQVNSVSGSAPLSLTLVNSATSLLDVPTWHYDRARTGLYSSESRLTPTSVTATTFGKRGSYPADGPVDAQPLYLYGLTIGAQAHNVLYVATENDTMYALDADTGAVLWQKSALGDNETVSDNRGCSELSSTVGITSTPVIDRGFAPNGAIYFVAKTKDSGGNYHQRLHALDLTTGAELTGSPVEIAATYPANGGVTNTFDPSIFVERAALLLSNGSVYLSWAAPCQQTTFDYQSWVMAYSEATLAQQSVLDLTPNGSGGGIWMSGAGPSADADGNVFLSTSEGTFDTTVDANYFPVDNDYGNSFVKIQPTDGVMSLFDYFEPLNGVQASATNYQDQGSGGVLLVPDIPFGNGNVLSLAAGAGKDGNIYIMGRTGDFLGEYDGQTNYNIQTWSNALPNGASSTPAYFNQTLYYGGIGDSLKAFNVLSSSSSPTSRSTLTLGPSGATPVISANGTSTPIVWVLDTTASGGPVLHAYDANNVATELYNSTSQPGRDTVDTTGKFNVPVVANGHVYIGTQSGVDVFGLLLP